MSRRAAIAVVLLLVALGIRVGEIERTAYRPINDAHFYLTLAAQIARTGDYAAHGRDAAGGRGPTAYFAPAYPYLLAGVDLLDGRRSPASAAGSARVANALLGTAVVGLIGLVALELFGETVALIALAIAALYPVLIELSAVLAAENLLTALVLTAVYAVLRAHRGERRIAWLAAAGLGAGLAVLTHQNAVVVLIPLAIAAARTAHGRGVAILLGAALLTLASWTIRNAIVLHSFIPVSDETGITLAGTYNPRSAADPLIPYRWRLYLPRRHPGRLEEPALNNELADDALDYVAGHPVAPLAAGYHNVLRLAELEGSFAWESSAASIDLPRGTAEVGVISFWGLCALALAGAFTRPVRAAPRWLWLIPLLLAVSVVLVNAETPRFREPIDPFLILPAACAVRAAALSGRARRIGRPPARGGQGVELRERLT